MAWFKSKQDLLRENLNEEQAYAFAAYEVANGEIRPGLWAKAFAEAKGKEKLAHSLYIKLRVEQITMGVEITAEMIARVEKHLSNDSPKLSAPVETAHPQPRCKHCGSTRLSWKGRYSLETEKAFCEGCKKTLLASYAEILWPKN